MRDGVLFASSQDRVGFELGIGAGLGLDNDWTAIGSSPRNGSSVAGKRTELRARWHHYSLLGYEVPVSRLTKILPEWLSLVKEERQGEEIGWVWVQSFRDEGGWGLADRSEGFEQTTYSVSVESTQGRGQYLLGHAIGSLSAVGARNLWAQPWHLSAMELQVAWQSSGGGCREYRLHSQSQWDNSRWELAPVSTAATGWEQRSGAPVPFPTESNYFFSRGGAGLGQRRIRLEGVRLEPVWVVQAKSEFLERCGLVKGAELAKPAVAGVQQIVRAVVDLVDGEIGSSVPARQEPSRQTAALFQAA